MATFRIPLVGSLTNRNIDPQTYSTKDQQFINCYPQVTVNPLTGKQSISLYKRPGSSKGGALANVSSASIRGAMVAWTGHPNAAHPIVASFVNDDLATNSVWDLTADTKIGANFSAGGGICTALTETMVSSTANLVGIFINGSTIEQWFYPNGGTWTKVSDADFTGYTLAGVPAHMDGYVFNMTTDGLIVNSDLNSVSAYTAGSYISASTYPDKGVTVARLGNLIVGFGEKSIEFFRNTGNATGSPLSRVGALDMGAARRSDGGNQTVLCAASSIYWLGNNSDGASIGIYRFKGNEPEKVSNDAIDTLLAAGRIIGFSGTLVLHGMTHIVLADTGATFSWCYCVDTNFWWQLTMASGVIRSCLGASDTGSSNNAKSYFTTTANARGNTFPITAVNQDDSSNFTMTVQTENVDMGTDRRKFFNKLRVIADTQSAASNISVSWSDDDYATFSTARDIDMSTAQTWITALGSARRRAFKLTNAANTPCRIQAIEIDYEPGAL